MPSCCQALTSTPPPMGSVALLGSIPRPDGPLVPVHTATIPPAAVCHRATTCSLCLCGTARGPVFPLTWPPPPCKCSAGVATDADHAMVCEKVAKMTQMRHDNVVKALRLVVLPAAAIRRRSLAAGPWRARRAWLNASAGATSWPCCRGSSLRQQMSWLCMRLRSRTLLRPPRQLGGLWRGPNRPSGPGSGRMCLIMLHSGLCRLCLRRAGTRARRW